MTGPLSMHSIQGKFESILFARAISIAAALYGVGDQIDGLDCRDIVGLEASSSGHLSFGVMMGELKQRRYRAMKKGSFKAHVTKRTAYSFQASGG